MKKDVIIILPGIMGSNLYDRANGELLWPKFDFSKNIDELRNCPDMVDFAHLDGENGAYHWVDRMLLDMEGRPLYDGVVTHHIRNMEGVDETTQLGSNNEHRKLYTALYRAFHEAYDVILYEYDWRLDNDIIAKELEIFIDSEDYDRVVLVCHSMGGIIADNYLAHSSANRDKVTKLITLGTPHLGAVSILAGLEDPLAIMGYDSAKMDELHRVIDALNGEGACDDMLSRLVSVVHSTASTYGLLPLLSVYDDENGGMSVTSLGECVARDRGVEAISDLVAGRVWAVKKHVQNMISGWNKYFVGEKHVSELVDTTYIGGRGIPTKHSLRYSENGTMEIVMSRAGDRVVTTYSATLGKENDDNSIFLIDNCTHADLLAGDTSVNKVVDVIANITK